MKIQTTTSYIFISLIVLSLCSCQKYLDKKPDISFTTASTVADLQGLLDNNSYMNVSGAEAGEIASDNYYLTDAVYAKLPLQDSRDLYLWRQPFYQAEWQTEYNVVYNSNLVLDNLPTIARTINNAADWDNCLGSAMLFRGKAFLEIAQIWAKGYDSTSATTDLGIPLRLTSDYNAPSKRASVADTYTRIVEDLKNSIKLLPTSPLNKFRPSRQAAYGLLARTFLFMRRYDLAKLYSDSCLLLSNILLDYNSVDATRSFPFLSQQYSNPEDIMHSSCSQRYFDIFYGYTKIDTNLVALYKPGDLRKKIYFASDPTGGLTYQGSYDGYRNYSGLSTDEIYITRAECKVRLNDMAGARSDLNILLSKRYATSSFTPVTITDKAALLNAILEERRKELLFRMLRFSDIKRLNYEGAGISITRILNGSTYTLQANAAGFALPIPEQVIELSGLENN